MSSSEKLLAVGCAIAILIPCFWLPHIETTDLSSHLYNAWLAGQIEAGRVAGLRVAAVWTNVLGDLLLQWLIYGIGPLWTDRVVEASAVLLFCSGAFRLIETVTGKRPWMLAPSLAILAYGVIFQFGFLNHYLATGLCLWILALAWQPASVWRWLSIVPLMVLAVLAHFLAVVWAVALLAYIRIWRRVTPARQFLLPLAGLAALIVANVMLMRMYPCRWLPADLLSAPGLAGLTGVEQAWIFGTKYAFVAEGLLLVWAVLLWARVKEGRFLADPLAHLWLLHMAAFALIPSAIQFPQYQRVLSYIPQRISLFTAIVFCIMVGGTRYRRGTAAASAVVAAVFFTFLYRDGARLNKAEGEITALIAKLPAGQTVVGAITDSDARVNALDHVVDRACIGRCFSYADYEPSSGAFRIRVVSDSAPVAPRGDVLDRIAKGTYIVPQSLAPVYSLCQGSGVRFELRLLHAGQATCALTLPVTTGF